MSSVWSYSAISLIIVVVAIILSDVHCRDASSLRQSDVATDNLPKLPSWDSGQKNNTTPWPALGNERHRSNSNLNNPTWVRPAGTQNPMTWSQRQSPNRNFNVGPSYGNGQESIRSSVSSSSDVQDDELREFSETLLTKDVNNAANHVTINVQRKTTSRSQNDEAPLPLLSIDKEAFKIPSIQKLLLLYNNYIVNSNTNEQYTADEKEEEDNLLEVMVNTPVMQHTKNFLIEKGKIGRDPKEFKNILRDIWFNMYSRVGGRVGSSGFEHVFLAEIKKNKVSGLHNWLYFHEEEKNNQANYLGYMRKIDLGDKGAMLKFHFTFHGVDKPVGSIFIGTSPEFEMALYTTCFLFRADKICPLKLKGNRFIIRTYTYPYGGKNLIGSAYPDI